MLSLLLASSLWLAGSEAGARPDAAQAVVVPVEKIADGLATDLALNALGTGLDLLSTDFALHRGCVEGNPLAPRVEGRVALKMGGAAMTGAASYWLRRKGHKRAADVLRYARLAVDLGLTVNNVACGLKETR